MLSAASPAHAYRTAGDLPEFNGTERVRWADSTVRFERHVDVPTGLSGARVDDVLLDAFRVWAQVDCSNVQFDNHGVTLVGAEPGDGRNTIQWLSSNWTGTGAPEEAAALADVQYEKSDGGKWQIVEADLYFNAEHHSWGIHAQEDGVRDLPSVATHEIGHILGLLHPCEFDGAEGAPSCDKTPDVEGTTMYPIYSAEQLTLSDDDEEGLCFLYPASDCEGACPDGTICTETGCEPSCGGQVCGEEKVCLDSECIEVERPTLPGCGSGTDAGMTCEPELPSGVYGDPCASSDDCASGICGDRDYCSNACTEDSDCGPGARCDGKPKACVDDLFALGQICSEAAECIGNQCLAGFGEEPVCTRLCGSGQAPCPEEWECRDAEDRKVCVPSLSYLAGGAESCAVASYTRNDPRPIKPFCWCFGTLLLIALRRSACPRHDHTREPR